MSRRSIPLAPGDRYGRLVVIDEAQSRKGRACTTFRCDCGTICVKDNTSVRRGRTKSCGCLLKETAQAAGKGCLEEIPGGTRFARWKVLHRVEGHPDDHGTLYQCRCDCGTERLVLGFTLKQGKSKSCGCHRADRAKTLVYSTQRCKRKQDERAGSKEDLVNNLV